VVDGTVRVVTNVEQAKVSLVHHSTQVAYSVHIPYFTCQGLNGEILVTARTDPGWVPLYPLCSGLIIERGR